MLSSEKLKPYQRRMIKEGLNQPCIGLLMDMGLGKTITTLSILAERKQKTLIIAPKAVAKDVWAPQAAEWEHTKHLTFSLVLGDPKRRLAALRADADVYVTNLENVVWLFDQKDLPKWNILVIDESSKFKSTGSQRWRALKKNLKNFQHRYILTGTPVPRSYLDLWSQVGILDLGQRLGKTMTEYKDRYFKAGRRDPRTGVVWTWDLRPGAKEEIDALISDICFSLKAEDYLKMPPRQDVKHEISWSPEGRRVYDVLRKDMVVDEITARTAGDLTNKLLQAASGNVYDDNGDPVHIHDDKLNYLADILDDNPTIIFYNFRYSLKRLKELLPDAIVLDPEDTTTMQRWRKGEVTKLLCHPKSVGIGLNLQCNIGDTVQIIWFDLTWSPEDDLQSNARVFRQGQEKPVIVHRLTMKDSIDERVMDVLEGKIGAQEALMQALKLH